MAAAVAVPIAELAYTGASYVAGYLADLALDTLKVHLTDNVITNDNGTITNEFDSNKSSKQKVSEDLKTLKISNKQKINNRLEHTINIFNNKSSASESPLIQNMLFASAGVSTSLFSVVEFLKGIEDSLELLTSAVVGNMEKDLNFKYDDLSIRALQMYELIEAIKGLGSSSNPLNTAENLPKLLTALESVGALNSTLESKLTTLSQFGIKDVLQSGFNSVANKIASFDSTALVTAVGGVATAINNQSLDIDLSSLVTAVGGVATAINEQSFNIDLDPLTSAVGGVKTAITENTSSVTLENLNFELAPELATVLAGIGVGLGAVGSGLNSVSGSLSSTLSLSSPNSLTTQIKRKIDLGDDCECADALGKISDNLENISEYFGFMIGDSAPSDSSAPAYYVANYFQEFSKTAKDLNDFDLDDISDFLYKSSNLSIDDMEVKDV